MSIPNIIFHIKYAAPYKPGTTESPETKWRDWVSGDLIYYATRNDAVEKETITNIAAIKSICDNSEMDEADAKAAIIENSFENYFDYTNNRPGSTGAFNADGDISTEQIQEIKRTLKETKSIIWTGILSFEEEYGKKYCNDKASAYAMMCDAFPSLFKNSHLKYENISWYATLHRNTDNRHIHITFWEKEPSFFRKGSTDYYYSNVKKIKQDACNDFKFSVAKFFEVEHLSSYKIRDSIRENLRRTINTSERKDILDKLLISIRESNSWQFGKQNEDTKNKILQFALGVIEKDESLKIRYNDYVQQLIKQQEKYYKICKESNIPITTKIKEFANNNLKDLHTRLGNDVIKVLKFYNREYDRLQQKYKTKNNLQSKPVELTSDDLNLLQHIYTKPTGAKFKALFEGTYTTDTSSSSEFYYRTEEAATLAFASILIFFTQNHEQFKRILCASKLYKPELDKQYEGQLDFVPSIPMINTNERAFKDVLFDLALGRYNAKTRLPQYDNSSDISNILPDDISVMNQIIKSKWGNSFNSIMMSKWENTQHDTKNELFGYHLHCYHLIDIVSKFTQDSEQIERIFKCSLLYKPTIWNDTYKSQIPFIATSNHSTYGKTLIDFCLERRLKWKEYLKQGKQGKLAKQEKFGNIQLIAHRSGREIASIVQNAFSMLNTNFDHSFNQFQNAIKEQERRRKAEQGDVATYE